MPTRQGAIRIFRFAGISVFLHWTWFLVGVYEVRTRGIGHYSSIGWNVAEYLALFVIVTLHEFGHALACRQVGGTANQIVLWPLGGVAYVDPPPRPGATLWSIAAGPLVNLLLAPVFGGLYYYAHSAAWAATLPDLYQLVRAVFVLDIILLLFNVVPVYPLDGGQILRSLLWFIIGRARSLMAASVIGFLGVGGFILYAVSQGSPWLGIIAIYMGMNCWAGFKQAQALSQLAKIPRRQGYSCPTCQNAPPIGEYWKCGNCQIPFDTFATGAVCPHCNARYEMTRCIDCGRQHPLAEWMGQTILTPQA